MEPKDFAVHIDYSKGGDHPCVVVARPNKDNSITITNVLYDDDARQFEKLLLEVKKNGQR